MSWRRFWHFFASHGIYKYANLKSCLKFLQQLSPQPPSKSLSTCSSQLLYSALFPSPHADFHPNTFQTNKKPTNMGDSSASRKKKFPTYFHIVSNKIYNDFQSNSTSSKTISRIGFCLVFIVRKLLISNWYAAGAPIWSLI